MTDPIKEPVVPPPSWGGVPAPKAKPSISGFGEVSYGAKCEILGGSKYEMMAGNKSSALIGMDNKFTFGAKTDMSIGSDLKISIASGKWENPKNKWWPAKGFQAKYDFSDVKEHKLIISKDGSTDILVKKLTMAKDHFQASAGYGELGGLAYTTYTNIVSNMITVIATINVLLPILNLANALTVNPAANKQIGFDHTSQLRTSWIPFTTQLFATFSQLVAAINVVLSRDMLKKAVLPNAILQLRDEAGAFLGSRHRSAAVLTGIELGPTIKMGARKPKLGENLTIELGANFYKKESDQFVAFKEPPESYFEASPNKSTVFSKTIEIQANKDQKKKVNSKAGSLDAPKVLIKADGDPKANVECQARKIVLRTREKDINNKVELVLDNERLEGNISIGGKDTGLFMKDSELSLKNRDAEMAIEKNSVFMKKKGKGSVHIMNSSIIISHGSELNVSKAGVKVNGNLVVLK